MQLGAARVLLLFAISCPFVFTNVHLMARPTEMRVVHIEPVGMVCFATGMNKLGQHLFFCNYVYFN